MILSSLNTIRRADRFFGRLENLVLVCLVVLLAGMSFLQIVLRNIFGTGLVWSDDLLRHGVLWLSFLGAVRATAENKHIKIDILPRFLSVRGKFAAATISSLFSLLVCLTLFWASWIFVRGERQIGDIAFANIPYWWLEVIFPVSFALMALRFGFGLIDGLLRRTDRMEP